MVCYKQCNFNFWLHCYSISTLHSFYKMIATTTTVDGWPWKENSIADHHQLAPFPCNMLTVIIVVASILDQGKIILLSSLKESSVPFCVHR